jgi:hypothetical protein
LPQNFSPGSIAAAHAAHESSRRFPHWTQKRLSGRLILPQFRQVTAGIRVSLPQLPLSTEPDARLAQRRLARLP